ncbi:hypothetical protein [Spongiactinospora sp. 9N601]|uniref:hypothetical protein n=1 Tax=Spongiactinospora sp. 9N601 TaxID=3375149 RepID=UPI00379CDF83
MSEILLPVVVIGLVVAVVIRRFRGEPLTARDLFVAPVVLVGIGAYGLIKDVRPEGADLAWVVAGAVAGLLLGAVRGLTPRLFARDGHLWQRYTVWTLLVWVGSVVVNFGIGALATAAGTPEQVRPMGLSIGIGLLGEAVALGLRARAMGVPFAPEEEGSVLDRLIGRSSSDIGGTRSSALGDRRDRAGSRDGGSRRTWP